MSSFYPSDRDDEAAILEYLRDCSGSSPSIDEMFLKRLDYHRKLLREIAERFERAIDNMSLVRIIEIKRRRAAQLPQNGRPHKERPPILQTSTKPRVKAAARAGGRAALRRSNSSSRTSKRPSTKR